ncbi:MAG: hypothetical protein Q8L48_29440 [Archangium sp.]|nr:hypothetical protein [Archangium sp.]
MALVTSLVACSIVASSPAWLVVPGDAEESSNLASIAVVKAMGKSGRGAELVPSTHAARQCGLRAGVEQPACFEAAAPGARVLVVSGVVLRDRFALTIAVLAKDGAVLEEAGDKGALTDVDELAVTTLGGLARALGSRETSDAPRATTLEPVPRQEALVLPAAPASRSRAPAWIATGVAAAAAGVAVAFLAMGLQQKSTLDGAATGELRHSQADAIAQQANTDFSVALGAGVGAAATGVLAGVLWGSP